MDHHMSRRRAIRLLGGAALATIPALKLAGEASAARSWCRRDPLYLIGDYLFDVAIASDVAMLSTATGPVKVKLIVPPGLPVRTLYQDDGFGHGYATTVEESANMWVNDRIVKLRVRVVAPSKDATLPVEVSVSSLSSDILVSQTVVSGLAGEPVVWKGKIEAIKPFEWLEATFA